MTDSHPEEEELMELSRRSFIGAAGALALVPVTGRGRAAAATYPPNYGEAGTYWPSASTTGVPAGTVLKVVKAGGTAPAGCTLAANGDLSIVQDGLVIQDLDIHGNLLRRANHVTVQRCIIRGRSTTTQRAIVDCYSAHTGFLIRDCEIAPAFPSVYVDGIKGYGWTARRLNIHDTVDLGLMAGTTASLLDRCYLHHNRHYASDPVQGGGPSHDDGCQVQGSQGNIIQGSTIACNPDGNSCVQVTQDSGRLVNGLIIRKNKFSGAGLAINCSEKGYGAYKAFEYVDNVHVRGSFRLSTSVVGVITASTRQVMTYTGNVYEDGSPATVGNAAS